MRFFKTRGYRKFKKNRLAVGATVIIALYLLIAISILLFAFISLDETRERVGPRQIPGFGSTQEPEKRLEDARFHLDLVERALRRADPEAALGEIRLGELRVKEMTLEELEVNVEAANKLYDEMGESEDLNQDPALWPKLAAFEETTRALFDGWDDFGQRITLLCGTDRQGRSISMRVLYGIKIAVQIGTVTALFSVILGSLLGAAAAFYGGWVDHVVIWLYSTLSSIPYLVLLAVLVFVFEGGALEQTLIPVYAAFCLTFWIGPCRVIRGEALRIKELDYVQAATALGQSRFMILVKHVIPNTWHLIFVNFSLLFIGAIKSEVILSFLGLGVKNQPSWGIMINQSKEEVVNEFFWQIGAATVVMFFLVLAFNIFTDALQDAVDPKHIA